MGNLLKPTMQLFCSFLRQTEDQVFSLLQACFLTWNCTCYPQNWLQLVCQNRLGRDWLDLCTLSLRKSRCKCRLIHFAHENWSFLSKIAILAASPSKLASLECEVRIKKRIIYGCFFLLSSFFFIVFLVLQSGHKKTSLLSKSWQLLVMSVASLWKDAAVWFLLHSFLWSS